MSHFEYVSVAYTFTYALAVGRRLSGLSAALNSSRSYWVHATWIFVLAGCGGGGGSSSSSPIPPPPEPPVPAVFADPLQVAILGYEGDAMEPEISHDGEIMFFNNLNAESLPGGGVNDTDVHYATRLDDHTFQYMGRVVGASENVDPATNELEGTPSIDASANLYFLRTADYFDTNSPNYLKSAFVGEYANGSVINVTALPNFSQNRDPMAEPQVGELVFDVAALNNGETVYFSEGIFSGRPGPDEADIGIAVRQGEEWGVSPDSKRFMGSINTDDLEYAADLSDDGLELFFTRLIESETALDFGVYTAVRDSEAAPWGEAVRIEAIKGQVTEGPSITSDGRTLYYHAREAGIHRIYACNPAIIWRIAARHASVGVTERISREFWNC